jgi:hypothetical protein
MQEQGKMLTRGLHGLHGLHGLSLRILSIVITDIAFLNEFNALYYRRRDSSGVILREGLESHNPRNYIFKKERFNEGFNLNRTLVFLILTLRWSSLREA